MIGRFMLDFGDAGTWRVGADMDLVSDADEFYGLFRRITEGIVREVLDAREDAAVRKAQQD